VAELGDALEDAAMLLARRGDVTGARAAFVECTRVYASLSARKDLDRAEARMAEFGIRRTPYLS
jgi:hypothetical protein